ncbi:hypothetical protein GOODEAATRI_022690 [Goodea atripinnis]|uniref:Uncharacterized protein n=1 Tax=Goodea atripinnis TaxID=208336 RepID=A0ABV0NE99_9TELE
MPEDSDSVDTEEICPHLLVTGVTFWLHLLLMMTVTMLLVMRTFRPQLPDRGKLVLGSPFRSHGPRRSPVRSPHSTG